jgi:hypothetical protein
VEPVPGGDQHARKGGKNPTPSQLTRREFLRVVSIAFPAAPPTSAASAGAWPRRRRTTAAGRRVCV